MPWTMSPSSRGVRRAMTRRRWLIVLGAITIALAALLLAVDPSSEGEGRPGIVAWEFAWDEQGAAEILADWGEDGRDAARLSLRLDFLYLLAYGAFLTLAAAATRDLAAERGWRRMARFGPFAMVSATAGALFDAVEDVCLLIALEGEGGDLAPRLGAVFASLKFLLLSVVCVYLLAGLWLRFRDARGGAAQRG
jgi:hypothetical protein